MINIYFGNPAERMTIVDIVSIVLAAIAIVVSICTAIATYRQGKKGQRISLEAEYFREVFKDYLLNKLPNAWRRVSFACGKIIDDDDLQTCLNSIIKDALYFKFSKESFFIELKEMIESIEDELVNAHNCRHNDREEDEFKKRISRMLHELYHYINKQYYGV